MHIAILIFLEGQTGALLTYNVYLFTIASFIREIYRIILFKEPIVF